jgi:hypothetical protein
MPRFLIVDIILYYCQGSWLVFLILTSTTDHLQNILVREDLQGVPEGHCLFCFAVDNGVDRLLLL